MSADTGAMLRVTWLVQTPPLPSGMYDCILLLMLKPRPLVRLLLPCTHTRHIVPEHAAAATRQRDVHERHHNHTNDATRLAATAGR